MAQPVLLRYINGDNVVQIPAHYIGGLEADMSPGMERASAQFLALDPMWEDLYDSADTVSEQATLAVSYLIGKVDHSWINFNNGGTGTVRSMVIGADANLYIGGLFSNWDGNTDADRIAMWDGSAWNAVGTGIPDGGVYDLLVDPLGNLYAVGTFTSAGGVANTSMIAMWDGSSWNAVGSPSKTSGNGIVRIAIDSDSNLYVVGDFTNFAGIADADYIAMWDGSSWNAVGTPSGGGAAVTIIEGVATDSNDNVYVSGRFDNLAGNTSADNVAYWDGSSWNALETGFDNEAFVIRVIDDQVYAGGAFTYTGTGTTLLNSIARWGNDQWIALNTGVNGNVYEIAGLPTGDIVVGGNFTSASGLSLADRVAVWRDGVWVPFEVDLPGSATVYKVVSRIRIAIPDFEIYLAFDTTGDATIPGNTTVTVSGSTPVYPRITIRRSGGTSAVLEKIRNETTQEDILFNLPMQDGEKITIDLSPRSKSIKSSLRGNILSKLLPGSNFSTWRLNPGDNTVHIYVSGDATIENLITWRNTYWSADDSVTS